MGKAIIKCKKIRIEEFVKALELAKKENETAIHGIEKEFAFTNTHDLSPVQKIGRHSAYKFVLKYGGIPADVKNKILPEVFDYMTELITEPKISFEEAVQDIIYEELILWQTLDYIKNEFPGMDEILLSSGTLYRPAQIDNSNIPEVWGEDKRGYLEQMVKRYGQHLTPQGMHGNISIPEPLIEYQYHRTGKQTADGSIGYWEFKNEVYVWLASKMRAFASLILAIEANSPFDWVIEDEKTYTVLSGYNSTRWMKLPRIASTNHPYILKDYANFQIISEKLIKRGIIIGANNYMPVRPKGERRLGEVALSLERAAWFYGISLDQTEIKDESLLASLSGYEDAPFIIKLKLAEKCGWLKIKGYTMNDVIKIWQRENVRRLLAVPLNRIEIRCEENGGDYEFELAKAAFVELLSFYIFANPEFFNDFKYSKNDIQIAFKNEQKTAKYGLDCEIIDPFNKNRIPIRIFLKEILDQMENLARAIGYYKYLKPIYELANGEKNQAAKQIEKIHKKLGKDRNFSKGGQIIVPEEIIREMLKARKNYLFRKFETSGRAEKKKISLIKKEVKHGNL